MKFVKVVIIVEYIVINLKYAFNRGQGWNAVGLCGKGLGAGGHRGGFCEKDLEEFPRSPAPLTGEGGKRVVGGGRKGLLVYFLRFSLLWLVSN